MGNKAYKDSHRKKGLCVDCSRNAIPGSTRCTEHSRNQDMYFKEWYAANQDKEIARALATRKLRVENGCCPSCGAPLGEQDEGFATCINCRMHLRRPKNINLMEVRCNETDQESSTG